MGVFALLAFLISFASAQRITGDFIAGKRIPEVAGYEEFSPASFQNSRASADVNGDGKADFVISDVVLDPVTNQLFFGIHTLLNNGDGSFRTITARASDSQAALMLADLDGDGKVDLVSAKGSNSYLYPAAPVAEVSFGNGDGTFSGTQSYNLGENTTRMDVGDVNGDGAPDLVFATSQDILVFLNGGNRTFSGPLRFDPTVPLAAFIVADVNGDGRSDLIFSDGSVVFNFADGGRVGVALGTPTGAFTAPVFYKTALFPDKPQVGDLNGDGLMDLVVPSNHGIDLLLGDGNGSFHRESWPASSSGTSAMLADLNRDGKLDLILVNDGSGPAEGSIPYLRVHTGHGDGTFSAPRLYDSPNGQDVLGVADVNGDGAPDLVMSDLTVLLGDGFGSLRSSPITRSPNTSSVVTGDFNRDGKPDLAVTSVAACNPGVQCPIIVTMLPGSGSDWFQAPKTYQTGLMQWSSANLGIAAGDLNADGYLDLVIRSPLAPSVSVSLGDGQGNLSAPRIVDAPIGNDTYPGSYDVFVADVNQDGKPDIVVDSGVLLGQGDGSFQSLIPFPGFPSPGPQRLAIADFNGDGKLDVAVSLASQTNPGMAILMGDGRGNFTIDSEWAAQDSAYGLIAARMNADSLPDLVVVSRGISVLLNKGNGTFPTDSTHYNVGSSERLGVGDFNGDGSNDVVTFRLNQMILLTGKGDGTLDQTIAQVDATSGAVATVDLDTDGALDVFVATPLGVSRFMNAGPASMTPSSLLWHGVKLGNTGAVKTVTVHNYSKRILVLRKLMLGLNSHDFSIRSMTCGGQLHPGVSCAINLVFAPQASGTRSAVLQVSDNFGNLQKVPLTGTGTL